MMQQRDGTTLSADYSLAEGFLVRGEWRSDFSNQPFFLSGQPGILKRRQTTATLGLIWWFGGKQGGLVIDFLWR